MVVQIKYNLAVLDDGHIRIVDAGKRVIAFCPLLLSPGACNDLAVKDKVHVVGAGTGGKEKAVGQVGPGVRIFHVNRLLGPGDDDGLWRMLNQVGQGRGRISHGVRAVGDDKAVVLAVVFLDCLFDCQPVAGLYVGAVYVHQLDGVDFTVASAVGHIGQDFIRCNDGLKPFIRALAGNGAACSE